MPLVVDKMRCPQNHRCPMIAQCPVDAISQDGFGLPVIEVDVCVECGKCMMICPMRAVIEVN